MKSEFQGIRAFYALHQHSSVTGAAKALNQPKSTISRRLAQLESEVGQALFIKEGNSLVLTRAGEVFAQYCQQFLALEEQSQNALQSLKQDISGVITLVAPQSLIRGWLRPLLSAFLLRYSEINIRVLSHWESLEERPDIILAIGEDKAPKNWRKQILGNWHLGVYASPDYVSRHTEISEPTQLEQHSWLPLKPDQNEMIHLFNQGEECQFHPQFSRLVSDNYALQIDLISSGYGIGLLPIWIVNNYLKVHPNKLVSCLPNWQGKTESIYAYYNAGVIPLRVQTLLSEFIANVPKQWLEPEVFAEQSSQNVRWLG